MLPAPHPQLKGLLPSFDGHVIKGELVLPDDGPAVLVAGVRHHVEVRRPHLKLPLPVDDGGQRGADQERTLGVTLRDRPALKTCVNGDGCRQRSYLFKEGVQEDDGLDGLSQPHLIRQDGVGPLSPGKAEPVQPFHLVQVQRAAGGRDEVWLLFIFDRGLQRRDVLVSMGLQLTYAYSTA